MGVLHDLGWTGLVLSVAQRVGVCCVTQSCGRIFFPHELSTGFIERKRGREKRRGKKKKIINSINSHSDSFLYEKIIKQGYL